MAVRFSDIASSGKKAGVKIGSKEAIDWFRAKALAIRSANPKLIISKSPKIKRKTSIGPGSMGQMFLFSYDPKGKETLPFYDTYPLVFPIEYYGDSFLGLNMHYLPPVLRARLMDALYDTINNNDYDEGTMLKISYKILAGASQFSYFKPCVKKYLFNHVGSSFMYINPDEWDIALMLPTERFAKASKSQVWADSRSKV